MSQGDDVVQSTGLQIMTREERILFFSTVTRAKEEKKYGGAPLAHSVFVQQAYVKIFHEFKLFALSNENEVIFVAPIPFPIKTDGG